MQNTNKYRLLEQINSPADLKAMPDCDLPALSAEIRSFLIEHVTETGGHLASNLGVVELSIALHRVFNSPSDHIIFDVGHQSYVHKILTGRREEFSTLRRSGGLSGFTKREESEHDPFGAGHSSTSVSAALGFARADRLAGNGAFTVAVVGDGAYTGGMIHEALNNCDKNLPLIIVLNENEMSISKNVGGFARYLTKIRTSARYLKTKRRTQNFFLKIPYIGKGLYRCAGSIKQFIKNAVYSSNYFEDMGLFYIGPVDGNDCKTVERLLVAAKEKGETVLLHLKTVKGKGFGPAEKHPCEYHGILPAGKALTRNFSKEMGAALLEKAQKDKKICAVTAAMCSSTGLSGFAKMLPERFFDVGIAEDHALTFSAGLAAEGMKPVFAVYSSFLQRGYDSIVHDIALQKLPVTVCVDRAGFAVSDGPTHHGIFDVAFVSHIPGTQIYAPATFASLREALDEALNSGVPSFIRYPNSGESEVIRKSFRDGIKRGRWVKTNFINKEKNACVIITYGIITEEALKAAEILTGKGIRTGVILLEKLKSYGDAAEDAAALLPDKKAFVVFLEEGVKNGGAAMLLKEQLLEKHPEIMKNKKCRILAVENAFISSVKGESIYKSAGISAEDVVKNVLLEEDPLN